MMFFLALLAGVVVVLRQGKRIGGGSSICGASVLFVHPPLEGRAIAYG
jgi:hypothetical protein